MRSHSNYLAKTLLKKLLMRQRRPHFETILPGMPRAAINSAAFLARAAELSPCPPLGLWGQLQRPEPDQEAHHAGFCSLVLTTWCFWPLLRLYLPEQLPASAARLNY